MRFKLFSTLILAFILPLAFLVLTFILERVIDVSCFTACEDGPVETLQAITMFFAFGLGCLLLTYPRTAYPDWARAFFTIGTLGSLYVALEEISYGQRVFGWLTPDTWHVINDQNETNLHNVSAWFDQKPRLVLESGAFVGGILIPAFRRFKPEVLPKETAAIYPSSWLAVTAIISLAIHIYDGITEMTGRQDLFWFDRGSEMQEIYLFWFVLLYFIFKRREFKPTI